MDDLGGKPTILGNPHVINVEYHSLKGILIPIPSSGTPWRLRRPSQWRFDPDDRSGCNIAWYQSCQHTSQLMLTDVKCCKRNIYKKRAQLAEDFSWRSTHLQFDHWFAPVGLEALTINSKRWTKSKLTSHLLNFDNDLAVMLLNSWHFLVHPLFPSCRSVRPLSCDNVHRAAATYLR